MANQKEKKILAQERKMQEQAVTAEKVVQKPSLLKAAMEKGEEKILLGEEVSKSLSDPTEQNRLAQKQSQISLVWTESKDKLLAEARQTKERLEQELTALRSAQKEIEGKVADEIKGYQDMHNNLIGNRQKISQLTDAMENKSVEIAAKEESLQAWQRKIVSLQASSEATITRYMTIKSDPAHLTKAYEKFRELEASGAKVNAYKTYSSVEHQSLRTNLKTAKAFKYGSGVASLIFVAWGASDIIATVFNRLFNNGKKVTVRLFRRTAQCSLCLSRLMR